MSVKKGQFEEANKLTPEIEQELEQYRDWIKKYRAGQIGEIKMQKIRLQLGTYHQRQEGVQMQRIKFAGGILSADQLTTLADTSEKFASGFIHFTTRQDAQLYYIKLEDCPDMMKALYSTGITTREACGNTVRNVTASYLSGTDPTEAFDVRPYCYGLYRFLVRNKYNQVMGRKFKIAFEGTARDHAGMRIHDFGFQAVIRNENGKERRGFKTWAAGGLGATAMLGHLYSEFLPAEELLNFAAATIRVFDRHGERKNRMAARMKYLAKKIGWDKLKELIDAERKVVVIEESVNRAYIEEGAKAQVIPAITSKLPANPAGIEESKEYRDWLKDNITKHKIQGYKGVVVRLKLGDLVAEPARKLADLARTFSNSELRIAMEQNLFLPWVPEKALPAVFKGLKDLGLADAGANTMEDTTTCPGADTCRLGITSAKGLGATISEDMNNGLGKYKELAKGLKIKISGCPNACAQHTIANIGFQGAALAKDGKTVPSHELFIGGGLGLEGTTIGERYGKFPARHCGKVVDKLLELYSSEKQGDESFNACIKRIGRDRILKELAPFSGIPSFDDAPDVYKDWGHDNEKFAVRTGIKGECAGAPIQEKAPIMDEAREGLSQAEALLKHKEFGNAQIEAYEAMAKAARVPLYATLVDPFTSEQALWEFENIFVRKGLTESSWIDIARLAEEKKEAGPGEKDAQTLIELARNFLSLCEQVLQTAAPKSPQPK